MAARGGRHAPAGRHAVVLLAMASVMTAALLPFAFRAGRFGAPTEPTAPTKVATIAARNSGHPPNVGDDTSAPASTQSETSVAVDATGQHVVVGFNDFRGSSSFSGFEYSDDGGTTFTDGGQLAAPPLGTVDGDPDVQYVPGGSFYPNGGGEQYIRLAYSFESPEKCYEGSRLLAQAIRGAMS